jgi:hypothetical protein
MLGMLINLLVAEKSGFAPVAVAEMSGMKELTERLTQESLEALRQAAAAPKVTTDGAGQG